MTAMAPWDVLLVEDDPLDVELFRHTIERERDIALTHAPGVDEALALLGTQPFPYVVTDLRLPGRSPNEVIPALKEVAPGSAIVVLSGTDGPMAAVEALRAGAHDYLRKDELTPPTLVRALRYARERCLVESRLRQVALRDPLTGIPNRGFFDEVLRRSAASSRRDDRNAALLWLDLDHFKFVNDHYGHRAGDALLRAVARRLVDGLREADVVCRVGGDEFGIILHGGATAREALVVARKVRALLAEPVLVDGLELRTSASIGVAAMRGVADADDLIRAADAAMYAAKAAGPGQIRAHDRSLDAELRAKSRLGDALRRALTSGREIELAFQPIFELESRAVWGLEALLRWRSADLGREVGPGELVPIAEECGLAHRVAEHVLLRVVEALRVIATSTAPGLPVCMNVSARQLRHPAFFEVLAETMDRGMVDPRSLVLEITEDQVVDDPARGIAQLRLLHERGVRIAIDDFGTGLGSLASLRELPVDLLKIDGSLTSCPDGRIRNAIVGLGNALGLDVVAEGIESAEQLAAMRQAGCRLGQGFFLGRPGSLEEAVAAAQPSGREP
jgi:diguanylate cyclase (GGDEF)-like protein